MTKQNLKEHAGFTVGEEVRYLQGTRKGMTAIVESIAPSPISDKSIVFSLVFDSGELPAHLQTQQVTFPYHCAWIEKIENTH
ncbi:MAG: hypothetical protein SAK29_41070 [Scytonema sp. PMC 1069.18]|nr:hypothetical protein [Scytonema sp. PMC 1069.18]MEC4881131.1 hypothetical protein [Scytonema sp. PMC 1070.18]